MVRPLRAGSRQGVRQDARCGFEALGKEVADMVLVIEKELAFPKPRIQLHVFAEGYGLR